MMGGQALCKVLFGDYNPAGRLPVTAARSVGQIPVYYALPRGSGYVAACAYRYDPQQKRLYQ